MFDVIDNVVVVFVVNSRGGELEVVRRPNVVFTITNNKETIL